MTKVIASVATSVHAPLFKGGVKPYVIAEPCIGTKDTACVDVCPCDCIHPGKDEVEYLAAPQLYIDPEKCIDCGACIPVCPVSAIFPIEELPNKWKRFAKTNANW